MKPPALGLLPGTRGASTYFPPRCGPPRDGPHGPSHPGQIFSACSRFSHLLKRNKTWDTSSGDKVTFSGATVNVHNKHGDLVASVDAELPKDMKLFQDKDGTIVPVSSSGIAERACTNNKWVKWGVGAAVEGLVCIPASAGTAGAAGIPCTIAAGAAATAVGC